MIGDSGDAQDVGSPPLAVSPLLVFDTIRRRSLSISITALLTAVAGGGLAAMLPLHYVATASLMVEDRKPSLTVLPTQTGLFGTDTVAVRTQVDLLRSPELERRVAGQLNLADAPEFARLIRPAPSLLHQAVGAVSRALDLETPERPLTAAETVQAAGALLHDKTSIVNDGRSYVIDIQLRTEDPALGAAIANAYAEAYLALRTRIRSEALRRAHTQFDERVAALAARVRTAEHAVQDYRTQSGLIEDRAAPGPGVTLASQQMAQLSTQLISATSDRARLDATLAQVRGPGRAEPGALPDIVASPLIQHLQEQEAEIGGREATLAITHGPGAPELMALRAARADLQRKIGAETARIVASLGTNADAARAREASLRNGLATLQVQVGGEGRSAVRLMELQDAAAAARGIYTSVLNRFEETANEVDMQEPGAVLVSAAVAPLGPTFPTRKHLALLVGAFAIGFAVFVALLRDRLRPGLRSAEALEALTGLPCLGFAPSLRGRNGAVAFSRSVAGLPASIGQPRPRVLLLTASLPGEGTSVLALALARSVAEQGDRVLLMISGRAMAPPVKLLPNLEVITVTPPALPEAQRDQYDLILLDAAPVLAGSETLPLAALADATVLVVRFGHTPPQVVARAARLLRRHGARLAGTVVTQVDWSALSARDGSELYLHRQQGQRLRRPVLFGRREVPWS